MTSSHPSPPPRAEPRGGLRARILQAAIELFATHGYGATSMRAIVEAVGCTKPALYYHFGSKAELFVEVHRTVQGRVREAFASLPEGNDPLPLRLERFIATLLDAAVEDPSAARLLLTATHRPEQGQPEVDLESLHSHNLAHLSGVLHHGQKQGEIRMDLSAEALSDFLLGMVHHRALGLLRGEAPPPEISRQIIDVFIHGARS